MGEADAQAAVSDDLAEGGGDRKCGFGGAALRLLALLEGLRGGGCGQGDIEVAFDKLEIRRERAQESVDGGGGQVAET